MLVVMLFALFSYTLGLSGRRIPADVKSVLVFDPEGVASSSDGTLGNHWVIKPRGPTLNAECQAGRRTVSTFIASNGIRLAGSSKCVTVFEDSGALVARPGGKFMVKGLVVQTPAPTVHVCSVLGQDTEPSSFLMGRLHLVAWRRPSIGV